MTRTPKDIKHYGLAVFRSCRFRFSEAIIALSLILSSVPVAAQNESPIEILERNYVSLIFLESCQDVIGYAQLATQVDGVASDPSEEEVGQEVIRIVFLTFLFAYADGSDLSPKEAAHEVDALCRANPGKPLGELAKN